MTVGRRGFLGLLGSLPIMARGTTVRAMPMDALDRPRVAVDAPPPRVVYERSMGWHGSHSLTWRVSGELLTMCINTRTYVEGRGPVLDRDRRVLSWDHVAAGFRLDLSDDIEIAYVVADP